jgi:hypothetical protein
VKAHRLQRKYYTATAARYDEMHGREWDEHSRALSYVSAVRMTGLRSMRGEIRRLERLGPRIPGQMRAPLRGIWRT